MQEAQAEPRGEPAKSQKREFDGGDLAQPPAKRNRLIESDLSETEDEDRDGNSPPRSSRRADAGSSSDSSEDESDKDARDSSDEGSSSSSEDCSTCDERSDSSDSEDEGGDYTCNFGTQRFQQDAQELV